MNVSVSAPSRLHFGLLSFGHEGIRQFGGIGIALASPRCEIEFHPHEERKGLTTLGPDAKRAAMFAERWAANNRVDLDCEIKVREAIPPHVGFGSGTQLALSIAAGLNAMLGRPQPEIADLATSVGRGLRSAVGTHAFTQGGLIVERGKLPSEPLAALDCRVETHDDWRFLLFRPKDEQGLSGPPETKAFRDLPPVPAATTEQLTTLIDATILPAARAADADSFGNGLYEYGILAGKCFEKWQGGAFANETVQSVVTLLREWGLKGVGQSSWGPTVFGFSGSPVEANAIADRFHTSAPASLENWRCEVVSIDCDGARIESKA